VAGFKHLQPPRQRLWTGDHFAPYAFCGVGNATPMTARKPTSRWNVVLGQVVYVTYTHLLTYTPRLVMKSKLTLRLDADLKEHAKRFAEGRGTSVSQLVEDYFRLLQARSGRADSEGEANPLTPRIERLKSELGRPAPEVVVDEDTEAWINAAAEKHS